MAMEQPHEATETAAVVISTPDMVGNYTTAQAVIACEGMTTLGRMKQASNFLTKQKAALKKVKDDACYDHDCAIRGTPDVEGKRVGGLEKQRKEIAGKIFGDCKKGQYPAMKAQYKNVSDSIQTHKDAMTQIRKGINERNADAIALNKVVDGIIKYEAKKLDGLLIDFLGHEVSDEMPEIKVHGIA